MANRVPHNAITKVIRECRFYLRRNRADASNVMAIEVAWQVPCWFGNREFDVLNME